MRTLESEDVERLWTVYFANRNNTNRNALVVHHLPLVRQIASQCANRYTNLVLDDAFSSGCTGLIKAIERFEPERGTFEPFASFRIRGAILDSIRQADWAPRIQRRRARIIEQIKDAAITALQAEPDLEQVAALYAQRVDCDIDTARKAVTEQIKTLGLLDDLVEDGLEILDAIPDRTNSPEDRTLIAEFHIEAAKVIVRLRPDDRKKLLRGRTISESGRHLVSQILEER